MPAAGRTVYCIVPRDLASDLHEYLREHWRGDPSVVVVVDRRHSDRRFGERRVEPNVPAEPSERRRFTTSAGRRAGDRRTAARVSAPLKLPVVAEPHAHRLTFLERLTPVTGIAEDSDTDRLITLVQGGDHAAFDVLYLRYYDRVYAYARVALRDAHEAEDVAQQVFGNVIEALPRYEVRAGTPFRSWLFRITRNVVLRTLQRSGRLSPQEPAEIEQRLERPAPEAPLGLEWLSDMDLASQVERLPITQRQVLLLRYVFEFETREIADALERTPVAIRMLEHRAMRALEARLAALRGGSGGQFRSPSTRRLAVLPVVLGRRLALRPPGGLLLL